MARKGRIEFPHQINTFGRNYERESQTDPFVPFNGGTGQNPSGFRAELTLSGGANAAGFVYDGLGRCLKRTINGTVLLIAYDDWKAIEEFDPSGNVVGANIFGEGADEILFRWQTGVGYLRYHHDVHGNVAFILGWGGEGLEKYTYDAFGNPTITDWNGNVVTQSAYGNRFMFQGREYLPELGIYDYRHRMYHPGLGRFLQTDPTGFDAGDMNLFRYCGDDPVDRSDTTGLVGTNAAIWQRERLFDSANNSQDNLYKINQRIDEATRDYTMAPQSESQRGAMRLVPHLAEIIRPPFLITRIILGGTMATNCL